MAGENESKTSIQDIAKSLLVAADEKPADALEENESPAEGREETTQDDLTTDDLADEDSEDQGQDEAEAEAESEAEEDTDEAEDDQTIIDIRDEDVIDVMIDGKLEQRTIGELKKAISGEGAIEKRLQEATELRKTAHAERTTILEKLAEQERIVANSLAALDDTVFKAVIPAPDPKMKDTNPAAYLRHKEAYDEDQKRIANAKRSVQAKVREFGEQRAARLKEYGAAASKEIA